MMTEQNYEQMISGLRGNERSQWQQNWCGGWVLAREKLCGSTCCENGVWQV